MSAAYKLQCDKITTALIILCDALSTVNQTIDPIEILDNLSGIVLDTEFVGDIKSALVNKG